MSLIAIISVKHKINPSKLFDSVLQAWNQEKAHCRQLGISCRQKAEDSSIFLFTIGRDITAQFFIPTGFLQGKNPLEGYVKTIRARALTKNVVKPEIEDLRAGMKRIILRAKVLEVPEPNKVHTSSGTVAYISNALIGDKTGTVRMSLWNEQINNVSEGDTIKIENGSVASFRGKLQLRIGRSGSLSVIK